MEGPSLFLEFYGISQVSAFHILFHRMFPSFMAISHPFSQDHTPIFYIFTGYFTGCSFHIFFHMIITSCFADPFSHGFHCLFHILLCEIPCEKGEPVSHGFHRFFTAFFTCL